MFFHFLSVFAAATALVQLGALAVTLGLKFVGPSTLELMNGLRTNLNLSDHLGLGVSATDMFRRSRSLGTP